MLSLIACIDILFLQRLSHSSDYEGMKCDTGSQTQEMAENLFTTEFDDDENDSNADPPARTAPNRGIGQMKSSHNMHQQQETSGSRGYASSSNQGIRF